MHFIHIPPWHMYRRFPCFSLLLVRVCLHHFTRLVNHPWMEPAFVAAVLSGLLRVFAYDVDKSSWCNSRRFMTTLTRGRVKVLCHMCLITQSTSWWAALTYFPCQHCRPLIIKQALLKRKQKIITTPWCLNVRRSLKGKFIKKKKEKKKHFDHILYFHSSLATSKKKQKPNVWRCIMLFL